MTPTLIAFVTVFVAELGDKTQLIAVGLGARHRLWVVAVGLVIGYGLSNLVAAAAGGLVGGNLPTSWVGVASAGVFLAFAALSARRLRAVPDADPEDGSVGARPAVAAGGSTLVVTAIAGIASAIVIGELGDKTQVATAALAANGQVVLTWVGATAGVTSAGLIGAVAGSRLAKRLTPRRIVALSTALFAGFGLLILIGAVVADDW